MLARAVKEGGLQSESDKIFDYLDQTKHPRLWRRKNSDKGREIALTHLKHTLHASFIKDLYEDTMHYFRDLLRGAAKAGLSPDRLVGEHKIQLTANDVLAAGDWDTIVGVVSQSLFRAILNQRSSQKLLKALDTKLGLGVDQAVVDAAMPFIELRHLLVHQDGVPDSDFCQRYPGLGARVGKKIFLPHSVVVKARDAIESLVKEFDEKSVATGVWPAADLSP